MKLSYIKGLRELNMSKWRLNQVDSRFKQQDQRIDRIGMTQRNRFGIGVGTQGSEHAIAVGYQRVVSENTAITFSGAFSQDEASAGVGVGFGWD